MIETELDSREAAPAAPSAASELNPRRVERTAVIRPAPRWPRLDLRELWHYRELLATFVWRDIKVRYKQTSVGVLWAVFVPVFTATIYIVIFGKFAKFPSGNIKYPVLVLSGLLPMQYFMSSLAGSAASIVTNVNLVTKVYFPRVLLPLAAVVVPVVDFFLAFGVLLTVMAWYHTWPSGPVLLLGPCFLAVALLTALGLGFFLSALNVRYRDVQYAIPVFLQVLPLLSGVPFAMNSIPEKWQWLLSLNPMTSVITGWRWAMLDASPPDLPKVAVSLAVASLLFVGGLAFFRSSEPRFADTI